MISGFYLRLILVSVFFINACSEPIPHDPSCRVEPNTLSSQTGKGACVVKLNNKLLVTVSSNGLYDLAKSPHLSSGPAQCSAHHGMWQQTGFNVKVGKNVGVLKDGRWLFECDLQAGFDGSEGIIDAPVWSDADIEFIGFVDIFDTEHDQWVNPDELVFIRDAFINLNK